MSSTTAKNVIQLRQLLAEKFPGVRMEAGQPEACVERWPTGVPPIDAQLAGGLAKSTLTEVISSGASCGSALLLAQLVRRARQDGHWMALVDGVDSFDPSALDNDDLARFLWVRCSHVREAMKALDLLLHDGTLRLVALDLISCPRVQLRRIPSSTWHRLARTLEKTETICLVLTPEPMVATATARLQLQPRFLLGSIDEVRDTLLQQVTVQPAAERNATRFRKAGGQ